VTFRIHRSAGAGGVVFALSGELNGDQRGAFGAMIERERSASVVLDLADVTLANREGIEFIRQAVAQGAELVNCPDYIRRWIAAAQDEAGS